MRAPLSLAVASVLLVACGGDKQPTQTETKTVDYSKLEITPQSTSRLISVGDEKLAEHLKNGMRLQLKSGQFYALESGGVVAVPASGDQASAGAGGSRGNFSETNVHVQGVDEADYAKYDGQHWFVATYPQYYFDATEPQKPGFQIVATDPATPDAAIVGSYAFDESWGDVGSLYLVQENNTTSHVAAVRNQWGNVYPVMPGFPISLMAVDVARPEIESNALIWPGPQNSKVRVQLVDVSTPAAPAQDWEIELDGSLIDSRKIGNTLYLITRYDPWLAELRYEYGDSSVRDRNEELLAAADTDELMPHYRIGDDEYPLADNCLVQEGLKDSYGLGSLVNITAIDLAGQTVLGSTCLNSNVEVMSMSLDSVYLTGTVYDNNARAESTVIHKFSLAETGPSYEATGSVIGSLGWNSDPAFRLNDYEGDLRIVTSRWTGSGPAHQLTILRQRTDVLVTQGDLPNFANPEPIGKPGEDIYAVRFIGTRAYIVTFQRTDPLYAIDLTDPGQPRILGELEIPGFATYMHPVGENLLFTLGHSADENGRVTGIKADLFDVSGNAPKVVNSVNLGDSGSHSEALSNLRALSLLENGDDQLRIALPISRYLDSRVPQVGLQLLEINGLAAGEASLEDAGMIEVGDVTGNFYGGGVNRAILHDDAVFFSHNNMIWAAHWDAPKDAKGPITQDPIVCTAEAVPSLRVTVFGDNANPSIDFCQANVTAAWGDERYPLDMVPQEELLTPPDGRPCVFVGPYEVGGSLDLHVDMAGYLPQSVTEIFVPKGICHVQTQEIRVHLKPENP